VHFLFTARLAERQRLLRIVVQFFLHYVFPGFLISVTKARWKAPRQYQGSFKEAPLRRSPIKGGSLSPG
jgi:hypothetical protein